MEDSGSKKPCLTLPPPQSQVNFKMNCVKCATSWCREHWGSIVSRESSSYSLWWTTANDPWWGPAPHLALKRHHLPKERNGNPVRWRHLLDSPLPFSLSCPIRAPVSQSHVCVSPAGHPPRIYMSGSLPASFPFPLPTCLSLSPCLLGSLFFLPFFPPTLQVSSLISPPLLLLNGMC